MSQMFAYADSIRFYFNQHFGYQPNCRSNASIRTMIFLVIFLLMRNVELVSTFIPAPNCYSIAIMRCTCESLLNARLLLSNIGCWCLLVGRAIILYYITNNYNVYFFFQFPTYFANRAAALAKRTLLAAISRACRLKVSCPEASRGYFYWFYVILVLHK